MDTPAPRMHLTNSTVLQLASSYSRMPLSLRGTWRRSPMRS